MPPDDCFCQVTYQKLGMTFRNSSTKNTDQDINIPRRKIRENFDFFAQFMLDNYNKKPKKYNDIIKKALGMMK